MANVQIPSGISLEQVAPLLGEVAELIASIEALKNTKLWDLPGKISVVLKEADDVIKKIGLLGIQLPQAKQI